MVAVKPIRLKKGGKGFNAPAVFLNPQTKADGRVIRDVNEVYPETDGNDGIQSIDGFVVDSKNWDDVAREIRQTGLTARRSIQDRVLIIDHGLDFLLRGSTIDKQKMNKLGLFDQRLIDQVIEISNAKIATTQKLDRVIREVYPMIDGRTVRDLMQFSFDKESDILVRPTVSITSSRHIQAQAEKAIQMIRYSKALLSTVFSKWQDKIDEMNILTVSASVLTRENFQILSELALASKPDHVGIRIMNLNNKSEAQLRYVLDFLKQLREDMVMQDHIRPVHLMNVDTFGYVAFCYGTCSASMPVGVDPYYASRGHGTDYVPPINGQYYHIQKKTYTSYKRLRDDTVNAPVPFQLPCYCEACQHYGTILEVEKHMDWNTFRRTHEVLARDIEITEVRQARVPIHRALRDMLGRAFVPYATLIPDTPIIGF